MHDLPDDLNYLFMDRQKPTLAGELWPELKAATAAMDGDIAFRIRWKFLVKMWPESTPKMFVETCLDYPLEEHFYFKTMTPIPEEDRFEIYFQIRTALQERRSQYRKPQYAGNDPYSWASRQIGNVDKRLQNLTCPRAAIEFVATIDDGISSS